MHAFRTDPVSSGRITAKTACLRDILNRIPWTGGGLLDPQRLRYWAGVMPMCFLKKVKK